MQPQFISDVATLPAEQPREAQPSQLQWKPYGFRERGGDWLVACTTAAARCTLLTAQYAEQQPVGLYSAHGARVNECSSLPCQLSSSTDSRWRPFVVASFAMITKDEDLHSAEPDVEVEGGDVADTAKGDAPAVCCCPSCQKHKLCWSRTVHAVTHCNCAAAGCRAMKFAAMMGSVLHAGWNLLLSIMRVLH